MKIHLNILAVDLDGTLAQDGVVDPETWNALHRLKEAGYRIILVTGRRLSVIPEIGPFDEVCEAIVAENGAAIHFPHTDAVLTPFGRLAREVTQKLEKLTIPVEFGIAIAATWKPHDREVVQVLSETGYAATVEYNKGAVMILPPGATKGSGLKVALDELGYSPRSVLACGDAENDRSLFEQADLAIAVSNAIPAIKDLADAVLSHPNGAGSRKLIEKLIEGKVPAYRCRPRRRIILGKDRDQQELCLSAFNLLDGNLGIAGSSGSGKSWLAGLIVEQLLKMDYQICVIDPEGDYRSIKAFPRTIVLGGDHSSPPSITDVITLLEYARISIILDLSLFGQREKTTYLQGFLQALLGLRAKRGLPHWFLIDEAHYFCHDAGSDLFDLIRQNAQQGGFAFVTYQAGALPEALLRSIDHWIFTGIKNQQEIDRLGQVLADRTPLCDDLQLLNSLTGKQAYLCLGETSQLEPPESGIFELEGIQRSAPHVRHLHKYLLAPLPAQKQFYFHTNSGESPVRPAASLWDFTQMLAQLPASTLQYHLERKDFERWLREVIHDEELARQLRKLAGRRLEGTALKEALCATVVNRFDELERLI